MNCKVSKVNKFEVNLGNPNGIYHPGQVLAGTVSLKVRDDVPVYGIHVWIVGQADVSWVDKPGGRSNHFEYEIYMKACITVWGREPTQSRRNYPPSVLPAGGHDYKFQYRLPERLPSSFESHDLCKGRVHYMLRARLESPDETARQSRDRVFIVLSELNLNAEPQLFDAVQLRKDKQLCCCCCKSGPISCVLRLDRVGYVPGEDINLDAELVNLSRKDVSASYVTMQQIVSFRAQGMAKCTTTDIFRISGGKIKPGDSAFYHDIIHIPPLPPSRLDGCRLIDVEYLISVGLLPSGMTSPVEVSVTVIIGTVPFAHIIPPGMRVSPSYSRYSHTSGEIEDYDVEDYNRGKHQHVYTYYKTLYKRADSIELNEVT